MASAQERTVLRDFLYEPGYAPTIPPGMTVAAYRRRRTERSRRPRRRRRRR